MARRASPGEGRPFQRSQDGRWVVVVRDPDGRRRCLYAWSRAAVIERRDDYRAAARMGLTPPPARFTVGHHLADWLADRRGKVRPSTWVFYELHVRMHLALLARIPLTKLTPNDVRRLIRDREAEGCSPASIRNTVRVLRMALKQAVGDGLVPRNVATLVATPRVQRAELDILQPHEAQRLIAAAPDDPLGALWVLLVGIGCRLGEASGLRWSDVDLVAGEVSIARSLRPIDRRLRDQSARRLQFVELKTDASRRTNVLPAFVVDALRRHRELAAARPRHVAGTVFTTPRGTPLDPRNISRAWAAFRDAAGLPTIRIHDLRHTAAAIALAQGLTLEDVKRMLGHATIAQTSDTYGHLVRDRQREVASRMDQAMGAAR